MTTLFLANDSHLQRLVREVLAEHAPDAEAAILIAACMKRTTGDRLDADTDEEYRAAFREMIAARREPEIVQMARFFRDTKSRLVREARGPEDERKALFRAVHHTLRNFGKAKKGVKLPKHEFNPWVRALSVAERELSARDGTRFFPESSGVPRPAGRILSLPRRRPAGGSHVPF